MKKLLLVVATLAVALGADAATIVLKGGKRLDVAGFQRQGNYFVVKYANGRVESYPVAAVDLDATRAAGEAPAAPAPPRVAAPVGPHSPFYGAQSTPGKPAVVVTDDDVQHVVPPDEAESGAEKPAQRGPAEGQVVLLDYSKQKVDDGTWEITATVINSGGAPVSGITADVRLLDANGATLGTGTGTMAGTLAPTQQGAVTTRVACPVEPVQISFSFHWQAVTPQPTPAAGEGTAAPGAPAAKAPAPAVGAGQPAGYTVPPGSSPTTMPSNPMAVPGNLTQPPTSLQAPRGSADKKQPG